MHPQALAPAAAKRHARTFCFVCPLRDEAVKVKWADRCKQLEFVAFGDGAFASYVQHTDSAADAELQAKADKKKSERKKPFASGHRKSSDEKKEVDNNSVDSGVGLGFRLEDQV